MEDGLPFWKWRIPHEGVVTFLSLPQKSNQKKASLKKRRLLRNSGPFASSGFPFRSHSVTESFGIWVARAKTPLRCTATYRCFFKRGD